MYNSSTSNTQRLYPVTSDLRIFLICTGLIYCLTALTIIGLDIGLIYTTYWKWYLGFSVNGLMISAGITSFVVACRSKYSMPYSFINHIIALIGSFLISIAAIVYLTLSKRCSSTQDDTKCDNATAYALKVVLLVMFILSFIHSIINLIVFQKISNKNARVQQTLSY